MQGTSNGIAYTEGQIDD